MPSPTRTHRWTRTRDSTRRLAGPSRHSRPPGPEAGGHLPAPTYGAPLPPASFFRRAPAVAPGSLGSPRPLRTQHRRRAGTGLLPPPPAPGRAKPRLRRRPRPRPGPLTRNRLTVSLYSLLSSANFSLSCKTQRTRLRPAPPHPPHRAPLGPAPGHAPSPSGRR